MTATLVLKKLDGYLRAGTLQVADIESDRFVALLGRSWIGFFFVTWASKDRKVHT